MFYIGITIDVSLDCINDTVVSHTSLNDAITKPRLFASPAIYDEIKPFFIVSIKTFDVVIGWLLIVIAVYDSLLCMSDGFDTNCLFGRLFKQGRKIEAWAEVQVFSTDIHQWMLYNHIRTMI